MLYNNLRWCNHRRLDEGALLKSLHIRGDQQRRNKLLARHFANDACITRCVFLHTSYLMCAYYKKKHQKTTKTYVVFLFVTEVEKNVHIGCTEKQIMLAMPEPVSLYEHV